MRVLLTVLALSTIVVMAACGGAAEASEREQELERQLAEVMSMLRELDRKREIELAPVGSPEDPAFQFDDAARGPAPARRQASAAPVQRQPAPASRSQPIGRPAGEPVFVPASYPAPTPEPAAEPVARENTAKRDAAIGAGVGAAVGAVVHRRNRVQGAIVGAAVGGIAGAVVGSRR